MSSTDDRPPIDAAQPVIVFDGVCNLCNASVDFVMRRDRDEVFLFAPAQEPAGKALLPDDTALDEPDSIALLQDGVLYRESEAVLRIARSLPWPWKAAGVGLHVPSSIRDPLYRFVARNRYRWFGRRDTCRLPTAEERARFLS